MSNGSTQIKGEVSNFDPTGISEIVNSIMPLLGGDDTSKQSQDAIALEALKASQKKDNTAIIVAIVILVLVFLFIGLLIYLKYKKK